MDYVTHMLSHHPHLAALAMIGPYAVGGAVGTLGLLIVTIFGGRDG